MDTIRGYVREKLNTDLNEKIGQFNTLKVRDWILFELEEQNKELYPLKIRYTPVKNNEIVYAVGWGKNQKDTKRTRHIQRRIHFVRDNVASRAFIPNKIDGELNPSDTGTKNLNGENLSKHCKVMHTTVLP